MRRGRVRRCGAAGPGVAGLDAAVRCGAAGPGAAGPCAAGQGRCPQQGTERLRDFPQSHRILVMHQDFASRSPK